MTSLLPPACDHPEVSRQPLPYQGRPADPREWECQVCGEWSVVDELPVASEASVFFGHDDGHLIPLGVVKDFSIATGVDLGGLSTSVQKVSASLAMTQEAFDDAIDYMKYFDFDARKTAVISSQLAANAPPGEVMKTLHDAAYEASLRRARGREWAMSRQTLYGQVEPCYPDPGFSMSAATGHRVIFGDPLKLDDRLALGRVDLILSS